MQLIFYNDLNRFFKQYGLLNMTTALNNGDMYDKQIRKDKLNNNSLNAVQLLKLVRSACSAFRCYNTGNNK